MSSSRVFAEREEDEGRKNLSRGNKHLKNFSVLLGVGPGDLEIERTADFLDSLFLHEPTVSTVVLVDDGGHDRQLAERFRAPKGCRIISVVNPRRRTGVGWGGALCTSVILGLKWLHRNADSAFVLKVDTDSLIIAPFAHLIVESFEALPEAGLLGSYDRHPNGGLRDFGPCGKSVRKLAHYLSFCRYPAVKWHIVQQAVWGRGAVRRAHIHTALKLGYTLGEHCQGGGYAISHELVDRMAERGYLDDPFLWQRVNITEDVMLGLYARAVGLKLYGLTMVGEPFGIQYKGLADTPQGLLDRGYAVIHSVKEDPRFTEDEIRAFFRDHRKHAVKAH